MQWDLVRFKSVKAQSKFDVLTLSPIEVRELLSACKVDKLTREQYEKKIEELNKKAEQELPALLEQAKNEKQKEALIKSHTLDENGRTILSKEWARKYKDGDCIIFGHVEGDEKTDSYEVISRSAVFLDLDHNANDLRDEFIKEFPYKAFLYDSFNSTKNEEKFRIIIPLDEEYEREDYELAWEHCASFLPENCLDRTAKEWKRKFYLPRRMEGGLFSYRETISKAILSKSVFGSAPIVERKSQSSERKEQGVRDKKEKKQKDPLSKTGYMGAFCKAYPILDAIKVFLPDVYLEGTQPNRLTYALGSTTDGVVVYGADKGGVFVYSHHSTDPATGRLCNAFDLVRLHKFGDTPESFSQMTNEIIFKDEKVQKSLEANYLFAHTDSGELRQTIDNCLLAFKMDAMLNGKIALNESDNRIYIRGKVDWSLETESRPMTNTDYAGITAYLETAYGLSVSTKIEQAILLEASNNRYDPVKDYLESLPKWDRVERIRTLLHDYLNAEKSVYVAEVTKLTLIGAIKRVYEAGCKFETMLVLVSPEEGIGKSTLFCKLAGEDFFSDQFDTLNGKESFEQLTGGWIIESAELEGMRKNDVQKIYKFLSKTRDKYRPAYGRVVETFKRRCIFVGTTNEDEFLRGAGANRRFYPVSCSEGGKLSIFKDLTQSVVDQIWAEAMDYYKKGDSHYLAEEHIKVAREQQEAHKVIDSRVAMVIEYLNMDVPTDWAKKSLEERRLYRSDKSKWKGEPVNEVPAIAIWFEVLNTTTSELSSFTSRESEAVRAILAQVRDFRPSGKRIFYRAYAQQRVWERIKK